MSSAADEVPPCGRAASGDAHSAQGAGSGFGPVPAQAGRWRGRQGGRRRGRRCAPARPAQFHAFAAFPGGVQLRHLRDRAQHGQRGLSVGGGRGPVCLQRGLFGAARGCGIADGRVERADEFLGLQFDGHGYPVRISPEPETGERDGRRDRFARTLVAPCGGSDFHLEGRCLHRGADGLLAGNGARLLRHRGRADRGAGAGLQRRGCDPDRGHALCQEFADDQRSQRGRPRGSASATPSRSWPRRKTG